MYKCSPYNIHRSKRDAKFNPSDQEAVGFWLCAISPEGRTVHGEHWDSSVYGTGTAAVEKRQKFLGTQVRTDLALEHRVDAHSS